MILFAEQEKETVPEIRITNRLASIELGETLEKHVDWLNSAGETGIQADLSTKSLECSDLIDARLQHAVLNKTNLKGADLTLADLRGASLLQANLAEANLLGTQFQQASLQAADLRATVGLHGPQLAGANLFGAVLPESVSPFDELKLVREMASWAGWFLALTLLVNGLVWLRIFTTRDAELLKNSSTLPISSLQTALPLIPFYLFGPVVILTLYVCFHLYMQKLWDGAAQLPAIFPDGRKLDASLPWFSRWPARHRFRWLRDSQSPLAFLEAAIASLLLYWVAPATVLLFWGRYLTLEDLRGTTLQILLVMASIVAAVNFSRLAGSPFGRDALQIVAQEKPSRKFPPMLVKAAPVGIGLLLFLLSLGTFLGVPHDYRAAAQAPTSAIRTWAPGALWAVGYNPFAQLTETDVSSKPAGWTGRDEEIALVKGPNLNRFRLRYLQAYGAFLVKARFWQTDLRGAYLSEADLRGANFRQADLQFAILDRARLARAALPEADLRNSDLDRADLREADLSFAALSDATLLDAVLDSANLYKSNLWMASLQRASLKQADLREANLENASLLAANLQGTYLASTNLRNARLKNADLSRAILTDANLRKSDLSGALLQGTVLRGADLAGAILQGADLRGAEGLTAAQACSAATLQEAQLDDNLQKSVASLCGNLR